MSSVTYNARGQVTAWTHGRFQDLPCAYDPVGNPVLLTNQLATSTFTANTIIPNTRRFAYDPRYRLVASTGKRHKNATDGVDAPVTPAPAATDYVPYTHRYSYDAVGNFTTNQEYSKSAVKYKAGVPDRFDGVGAESYGYDANGCVTSTPRHTSIGYQFDAQPTLIDLGGGGKIRLRRHGDQRVVRFRSATNAIRITLGAFEYEKTAGYTKVILHLEGPAGRCAQVERLATGTDSTSLPVFHVHGDHLGSGQALTKADATLLCQEEFFAYGRSSDRRDARNRYRFLGVERDEDTGLCMTGPRTYDPIVGRFLQGDPVVGGAAYVYSRANPVSRLDDNGYADASVVADPTRVEAGQQAVEDMRKHVEGILGPGGLHRTEVGVVGSDQGFGAVSKRDLREALHQQGVDGREARSLARRAHHAMKGYARDSNTHQDFTVHSRSGRSSMVGLWSDRSENLRYTALHEAAHALSPGHEGVGKGLSEGFAEEYASDVFSGIGPLSDYGDWAQAARGLQRINGVNAAKWFFNNDSAAGKTLGEAFDARVLAPAALMAQAAQGAADTGLFESFSPRTPFMAIFELSRQAGLSRKAMMVTGRIAAGLAP